MIIIDFYKRFYNQGTVPQLYFWQDRRGHEIELLVDKGNKTYPIEIKAGRTISHSFFKNTTQWAKFTDTQPSESLIISMRVMSNKSDRAAK